MKLRLLFLTVLVLGATPSFLYARWDDSTAIVIITFSNAGYPTYVDTFGAGVRYTKCIDKSLTLPYRETEQPPPPPPGNTDARFYDSKSGDSNCLGAGVKTSIHSGYAWTSATDTFEYQIQVANKNNHILNG